MKTLPLLIGIIVILAVFSSPVLAISKGDLISYYKGQTVPASTPTPVPTSRIPSWYITPTPAPPSSDSEVHQGSLSIISNPAGAMVFLDGIPWGRTPTTISGLTARWFPCAGCIGYYGTHEIKLTRPEYQDYVATVTVLEGQTITVSATLIPSEYTK